MTPSKFVRRINVLDSIDRNKSAQLHRRSFTSVLAAGTLGGALLFSQTVMGQDANNQPPQTKKPAEVIIPDAFDGEEDFEEACRLRLKVDSLDTTKEIIALAKSALKKGLDKTDEESAKKLIASTYLQKTQEIGRTIVPGMSVSRQNKIFNDLIGDLAEAIEFDPKLADAYLMKFQLHVRRNDVKSARDTANDGIVELMPLVDAKQADADTKVKLSRLLMARAGTQADKAEAESDLKKSIQYDANNQASIAALGARLVQSARIDEAVEFFQGVLESNPENELLIQFTAELLASNKDRVKDSLELLNKKIKLLPDSAALLKTRAKVHGVNMEPDLAKADLDRAVELSKDDIEGLLLRAKNAIDMDDIEAAQRDVDAIIDLAPDQVDAIFLRSQIASEQKRFGDAIKDLRLLLQDQPKESPNIKLLMQLGLLYSMDDRPTEAIKVFGQVTKLDSEYWQAYRMRGDTLLAMKEYSKAIADFEKALKLAPNDNVERSGILNNLSWTLSTSLEDDVRNGKRALELGLEGCELTEYKKPHILSTLAAAYAETGQFEKAVEWSQKAVELGRESKEPQLEQLEAELESYRKKEPWRERTEAKQNKVPLAPRGTGVDT